MLQGGYFGTYVTVWIDYNQNNFFDADEIIGNVYCFDAGVTYSFNFTVPTSSVTGNTRLRLMSGYNSTPSDPCSLTEMYGNCADFTVNIVPNGAPIVVTRPATYNSNNSVVLNGLVNPNGYASTVSFRYLLQGSSNYTFIAGSPSPLAGFTNSAVSAIITSGLSYSTYYFRVASTNSEGTSVGDKMTFTSPICVPEFLNCGIPILPIGGMSSFELGLLHHEEYQGIGLGCYKDYTNAYESTPIFLYPNNNYEILVTAFGPSYQTVWIDYNGSYIFEGGEELVSQVFNPGGTSSIPFTVPGSAWPGSLKLRIISIPSNYPPLGFPTDPCGFFEYSGNGWDFMVTILPCPSVPAAGTITGTAQVCQGSGGEAYYYVEPIANATGYEWSLPPGGSIATGFNTDSITVNYSTTATSGNVTVYGTHECGSIGATSPPFAVTVNPVPFPTISGENSVCVPSVGNVYATQAGMTGYLWDVSSGGTIIDGGTAMNNTVVVTWHTARVQLVSVNYTNANGCNATDTTSYIVHVNPRPVPAISGPTLVCVGTSGNVYTTEAGMTGYTWTVSSGGTITNTTATTLITESFENGGSIPSGWATEVVTGGNTISFVTNTSYPSGYSAYNGNFLVMFNSYSVNGSVSRLKNTTPISTAGYISATIDFAWLESSSYPTYMDKVEVQWSTNGTSWNTAGSFFRYNAVQGWKILSQALPPGALGQATLYIAFLFTSGFGNDCYLDFAHVTATSLGTGNAITVTWNIGGPQNVSVNFTDPNGCTAISPTVYNVTVSTPPPATRSLTNITIAGGQSNCYDATQTITTGGTGSFLVQTGGSVNLIAGQKINMLPLTKADSGGFLHAFISSQCLYCSAVPGENSTASRLEESGGETLSVPLLNKQPDTFFKVYPNPTTGTFTLELSEISDNSPVKVEIYGIYGEKLVNDQFTWIKKREFTLEGQPTGIYFIRVFCGDNLGSQKIIKQ